MNLLLEKGGKSLLLFISSTYDVSSDARVARSYIGKNQINYLFDKCSIYVKAERWDQIDTYRFEIRLKLYRLA